MIYAKRKFKPARLAAENTIESTDINAIITAMEEKKVDS